ncbi:unnamed protein product [Meloidogyne enterolobii]|uniref:Uncharacterized protein n=1 Tax=Meloidogyne enterolobii TaxID=390850 RepID=A0ACB0ZUA9_MELEN
MPNFFLVLVPANLLVHTSLHRYDYKFWYELPSTGHILHSYKNIFQENNIFLKHTPLPQSNFLFILLQNNFFLSKNEFFPHSQLVQFLLFFFNFFQNCFSSPSTSFEFLPTTQQNKQKTALNHPSIFLIHFPCRYIF